MPEESPARARGTRDGFTRSLVQRYCEKMLAVGERKHWRVLSSGDKYNKPMISRRVARSAVWSWREESNLQPAVYKTAALPIELRQPVQRLQFTLRLAQYQ